MKTSRLALGANPCGATHPCASASIRSAQAGRSLSHLAATLCLALISQTATAASVNVAWNPNPETNIASYQVCYGTSPGIYSNTLSTGSATGASVSGLSEGQTYYFAVKAINTAGLESTPSAEISYQVPLPPNAAPVAASHWQEVEEDQTVAINLGASDADGDPLSYRIISGPVMGVLSGSAPRLTYTPRADANGSDSFTFVANDGKGDSNTATVSINIKPVNDAPVAAAQLVSTSEDKAVGILLSASDKDGDGLGYRIISNPTKGALSGTAPNLIYIPNLNANGSDSFSFRANDGMADSNTATVSITISPVNDAPVAVSQMIAATAGAPVGIVLSASDADGEPLTFSIVGSPAQGSLSGTPPNVTYTPVVTASGADSFSFRASDGKANSNTATVSINITPAEKTENKPPVFQVDLVTGTSGKANETYTSTSFAGSAIDPDGDTVSYSKAAGPEWLVISPNGNISGMPPTGAEGLNSFTIRATDAEGAFDDAMLEITIQATELPLPWSLGRIGTLDEQSAAWGDATSLIIRSSGSLASTTDDALFTWQTLNGDGKIIARISSHESADSSSRIGLEIRESLAPNSKHVFIGTDGGGTLRWVRRTKTDGSTATSNAGFGSTSDLWLRLARNGDSIVASISKDGSNWSRISKINLSLPSSAYVGLMVCGGGSNSLSKAVFQDVSIKP